MRLGIKEGDVNILRTKVGPTAGYPMLVLRGPQDGLERAVGKSRDFPN